MAEPIPLVRLKNGMNAKTTRYKYCGIIVIRFTAKRGGVRCGACGKRIRKGTQAAAPESVWWFNGHSIVGGHEACVRRLIRQVT